MWLSQNILVPKGHFFWVRKQKHIDLSILFTLSSLSLSFPMSHCLVTFCLSVHPSLPPLLRSSFTHSFTDKKKHLLALKKLRPCTKTDTSPLALPFFHSVDEIFKQHFCSYLIACQHTLHKDSNRSVGLGSTASVSLGSVMFHKAQPRLERDGLSMRMLSVSMSVATTP